VWGVLGIPLSYYIYAPLSENFGRPVVNRTYFLKISLNLCPNKILYIKNNGVFMPTVLNDDQREQRSGFTNFLFRAAVTGLITIGILKSTEDGAISFEKMLQPLLFRRPNRKKIMLFRQIVFSKTSLRKRLKPIKKIKKILVSFARN
jgi:hypothetical protein